MRDDDDMTLVLERSVELGAEAARLGAQATRANRSEKDLRAAWEALQKEIERADRQRHGGSADNKALLKAYEKFTAIAARRLNLDGDFT